MSGNASKNRRYFVRSSVLEGKLKSNDFLNNLNLKKDLLHHYPQFCVAENCKIKINNCSPR